MSSVYSKHLQVFNAKQFVESISEPNPSNVYFTFGKSWAWANDSYPPQANTSVVSFGEVWRNMIGGKKFTARDVRLAIPRYDWTANTVYIAYDDLTDSKVLIDKNANTNTSFYVITDRYDVYKCIANNNGSPSLYKPVTRSFTQDQTMLDGYTWKYMYTLNSEEIFKFSTDQYIPVRTLSSDDGSFQWHVQSSAIDGDIHNILVTDPGTGYTSNNISVIVDGDGQSVNAFAIRDTVNNSISSIVIDNVGFGYRFANVSIVSTEGTGAKARAIMSPFGGHGSDPLIELGGHFVVINIKFNNKDDAYKLLTDTEYRQVSIVEDPIIYGSNNISGQATFSQVTKMILSSVGSSYIPNEYVFQGTSLEKSSFKGIVSSWDRTNNTIKLTNVSGIPTGDALVGANSFAVGYPSSVAGSPVVPPDLKPYTGKILYIDNIKPIARADDQSEVFKIILKF